MRILIVEDEPKVAAFLQKGLQAQTFAADVAEDGIAAEAMVRQHDYELLIVDVMMPRRNGIAFCRALRDQGNRTPILLLTALDATEDKVRGLDAGADDYLVKPFEFAELLARVRALLRRQQPGPVGTLLRCADLTLDVVGKTVTRSGRNIRLTAREFSLLEHLLRNQGRVVSRVDIVERVWDKSFDTGTNAVDVYINLLRKKVDKGFNPALIQTVTGMGYLLSEHTR